MARLLFEELDCTSHDEVRDLVLAGLGEHWGTIDEALNPDLDDMLLSYGSGRTVVARSTDGDLVGTGTVVPRPGDVAEIVRMSVQATARRTGAGRQIVDELIATARRWGCTCVVLETSTEWTGVVAFYAQCGFVATHVEASDFGSDTWFSMALD